jgi:hypothetical protein
VVIGDGKDSHWSSVVGHSERQTSPSAVTPARASWGLFFETGAGRLDSPVKPENDDDWSFALLVVVVVIVIVFSGVRFSH